MNPPAAASQSVPPAAGGRRTVLVVDDEPALRRLLATVLQRSGLEPLCVASAAEALAVVRARPVALVISDHALGARTGLDLLESLRAERFEIPFVLTSAAFPLGIAERARRAGADLVVEKGELIRDLAAVAARHLRPAA